MRRYMACTGPAWNCGRSDFVAINREISHYWELQVLSINYPRLREAIAVRPSLTFGAFGGLTPALLGKTFFSTRRPALETGGQRPTARCALGREIVWFIFSLAPLLRGEGRGEGLLLAPVPPHPDHIFGVIRPLPASGARL
jgi:hypothetical protein